jgi:hypothetical protein
VDKFDIESSCYRESDVVTRNLCILLKILGLYAVVSCACDKILLFSVVFYVVRNVIKFDFK